MRPLSFSLHTPSSLLRACLIAANLVSAAYLAAVVLVAAPITRAWECYPSRSPPTFNFGYCPQYTGQYHGNRACEFDSLSERSSNPRCDPADYNATQLLPDTVGHAGHAAFHVLAGTLTLHLLSIPQSLPRARLRACLDLARQSKSD